MDTRPLPDPEDFPAEADWLDLPPPDFAADFVDETLRRVREDRQEPTLSRELLGAWTVPEPSPGFVDRVLQQVRPSEDAAWHRMLKQHGVPPQSPDFVERVLRALREDREKLAPRAPAALTRVAPARRHWLAAAAMVIATAGAIWWASAKPAPTQPSFRVLAAQSATPDVWATRLTAMQNRGIGYTPADPLLLLGRSAGLREGE